MFAKSKDKEIIIIFHLTKVNVSKGTTAYLSPQPVFVPHSQLHGCKVSLSSDKANIVKSKEENTHKSRFIFKIHHFFLKYETF